MSGSWWLSLCLALAGCSRATPSPVPDKPVATASPPASAAAVAGVVTPPAGSVTRPPSDLDASNAFSLALYGKARSGRGNVFVSGTSVRGAVGIAFLGAGGETAREMASVFGFDPDLAQSARAAKTRRETWKTARGGAELADVQRLWVDRDMALVPAFVELTRGDADAVSSIALSHDAEAARVTIDAWVGERTQGRVPELLPPGSVTTLTRIVVTSAMYFKAKWRHAFDKSATVEEPFRTDDKTSQLVPMMHQVTELRFGDAGIAQVLELPYAGSDLAMVIVLPDERNGLGKIEATLSPQSLASFVASLAPPQRVALALPRFSFRSGGSIKAALRELGMRRAFESSADFTGMINPERREDRLILDEVFHQTFVEVDEVGTEAAAASAVVLKARGKEPAPLAFRVDRPFFFFVRDTKRGGVLFTGRLTSPKG